MGMYHRENAQEGFLVVAGECLLIVEEQERPLRQWDFFHCPGGTEHIIVGAGDEPAILVSVGARGRGVGGGVVYTVSETRGAPRRERRARDDEAERGLRADLRRPTAVALRAVRARLAAGLVGSTKPVSRGLSPGHGPSSRGRSDRRRGVAFGSCAP